MSGVYKKVFKFYKHFYEVKLRVNIDKIVNYEQLNVNNYLEI